MSARHQSRVLSTNEQSLLYFLEGKYMVKQAAAALLAETLEFVSKPSFDEFDDVKVCFNRLLGSFINEATFELMTTPLYDAKVALRMEQYGCIRSSRHLVNGCCPSSKSNCHDRRLDC